MTEAVAILAIIIVLWIGARPYWKFSYKTILQLRTDPNLRIYYWLGALLQIVLWSLLLQVLILALLTDLRVTDFRYVSF